MTRPSQFGATYSQDGGQLGGTNSVNDFVMNNEPLIRLVAFFGILIVMALWEAAAPRRQRAFSRWVRWPSNLGIVALNTLIVRLILPTAAVGVALIVDDRDWGLFNAYALPEAVAIAVSVVLLDFFIYLQHVLFHAVPGLWRLHRMHHADLDFDVTTGARFHPIEIVLSMIIKLGAVAALGAPALAVVVFEVVLNATAMFNHGNVALPTGLDRLLRLVVVTPDMHRVHHSAVHRETHSNFGFNLPWWDRLFGTYRDQPEAGHEAMTIGLDRFREGGELRLDRMLLQPFRGDAAGSSLKRGGPAP